MSALEVGGDSVMVHMTEVAHHSMTGFSTYLTLIHLTLIIINQAEPEIWTKIRLGVVQQQIKTLAANVKMTEN